MNIVYKIFSDKSKNIQLKIIFKSIDNLAKYDNQVKLLTNIKFFNSEYIDVKMEFFSYQINKCICPTFCYNSCK